MKMVQQHCHAFAALQKAASSTNHRRKFENDFSARKFLGL
jgi:hypothetical protein